MEMMRFVGSRSRPSVLCHNEKVGLLNKFCLRQSTQTYQTKVYCRRFTSRCHVQSTICRSIQILPFSAHRSQWDTRLDHKICNFNHGQRIGIRSSSTSSWLPEAVQNFSIWGGSGYLLKAIHMDGTVPYWATFALISISLRTALIPLVIYSAHTMARFAKVAPEIQFVVTLFQNDLKKLNAEKRSIYEKRLLFLENLRTVKGLYKFHNINPLTVFLSPLLQIPFFYYVAIDLRKIVNGADPALAQELTESSFMWVQDLTEPDPWYGLPVAAGIMLYWNVEAAIGRRSLSGPTASKSDFAMWLKDGFQTLAVFMPCFVSQSPSGMQIYVVSSFTFTLVQGAALRNDFARSLIGLPAMGTPPEEPRVTKAYMEFKQLEQKARDLRGEGPLLGRHVLAVGFETSFVGNYRDSAIKGSGNSQSIATAVIPDFQEETSVINKKPTMGISQSALASNGPFIHGISAPPEQLEAQLAEKLKGEQAMRDAEVPQSTVISPSEREYLSQPSEEAMEAANRGVVMAPRESPKSQEKLDARKFKRKKVKSTKATKRTKR